MVRLFVPEGEGQHIIVRQRHAKTPTEPDITKSPWRGCMAAAAWTGFLALIGRSQPGTFLKAAGIFGGADLVWAGTGTYGRHELHKGIFKMDKIEPKPCKFGERTKHWTVDDTTLSGGALGVLTAMNPRALPGVYGVWRFLGAFTVGGALGFQAGQQLLLGPALSGIGILFETDTAHARQQQYARLQEDEAAKASLSRVGKMALSYRTSPFMQILRSPLLSVQTKGLSVMGGGGAGLKIGTPQSHGAHVTVPAEKAKLVIAQVEVENSEAQGPDIEDGYRAYKDSLKERDTDRIQDWLERVQDRLKKIHIEKHILAERLSQLERDFYGMPEEDKEKDIFRRELQLLNNVASDMAARQAVFVYYEADAYKQLKQIEASHEMPPKHEMDDHEPHNYGPQIVTGLIRATWERQKEVCRQFEQLLSLHQDDNAGEHLKIIRKNAEEMKKNVEATERLLRWFEQQVLEAEERRD